MPGCHLPGIVRLHGANVFAQNRFLTDRTVFEEAYALPAAGQVATRDENHFDFLVSTHFATKGQSGKYLVRSPMAESPSVR